MVILTFPSEVVLAVMEFVKNSVSLKIVGATLRQAVGSMKIEILGFGSGMS